MIWILTLSIIWIVQPLQWFLLHFLRSKQAGLYSTMFAALEKYIMYSTMLRPSKKYIIYSTVFAAFQKCIVYSTVFAAFEKEKLSDDWWPMSLYTLCAWTMMAQESHTHLFPCPVVHKGNVWKSMLCCIDNQVKNSLHTAELKVNKNIKELPLT